MKYFFEGNLKVRFVSKFSTWGAGVTELLFDWRYYVRLSMSAFLAYIHLYEYIVLHQHEYNMNMCNIRYIQNKT